MSRSSETGKRGACRFCGGSSSVATTRCRSAAFASAVRNASGGVGQRKAPRCAGQRRLRAEDITK